MGRYFIKDLEHLSGIKAHTLRIWEQRHGVVEPKRTDTNIRYYDDEDLKHIMNVAYLNRNGMKISRIAKMSRVEIQEAVKSLGETNLEFPNQVQMLILAMVHLDEDRFEKILATNTLQFGFERTMMEIVYPFLGEIGILWQTGSINPAHEHFVSSLIRQKVVVAIDGQVKHFTPATKTFILFLPEGEMHEISLLFAAYLLRSRGHRVIYLGPNLPLDNLPSICEVHEPDYMMSIFTTYPGPEDVPQYLSDLEGYVGKVKLLISGYQALLSKDSFPEHAQVFKTVAGFISYVDQLGISSN
ncbi:MerR family transcriptional regulator [Pontibacter sp. G13]|uniref:MerR family transcriptional regulator n=1 Tax=Pontibacter sp. G13 TaxID=3074898 RepID=UPI00288B8CC6|nr:MerR family transcriptional regulator [Pontibacter sp. G13]WNJ19534.1 MerR family transcriptional regulator [Pontibacter sp. G13]